ncbi:hypothetical protein [Streptomyces platensis]|uniref:hypothetical protein n=1 Tax=Streptomyces platensis TaxID=58346 RepID=UPI0036773A0E
MEFTSRGWETAGNSIAAQLHMLSSSASVTGKERISVHLLDTLLDPEFRLVEQWGERIPQYRSSRYFRLHRLAMNAAQQAETAIANQH